LPEARRTASVGGG